MISLHLESGIKNPMVPLMTLQYLSLTSYPLSTAIPAAATVPPATDPQSTWILLKIQPTVPTSNEHAMEVNIPLVGVMLKSLTRQFLPFAISIARSPVPVIIAPPPEILISETGVIVTT